MQIEGNLNGSSVQGIYASADPRHYAPGTGRVESPENPSKTSATTACRSDPNQQSVSEIEVCHILN